MTSLATALLTGAELIQQELALTSPAALPRAYRSRYKAEELILRELAAQVSGLAGPVKVVGGPEWKHPPDCLGVDGPALVRIATALEAIAALLQDATKIGGALGPSSYRNTGPG